MGGDGVKGESVCKGKRTRQKGREIEREVFFYFYKSIHYFKEGSHFMI